MQPSKYRLYHPTREGKPHLLTGRQISQLNQGLQQQFRFRIQFPKPIQWDGRAQALCLEFPENAGEHLAAEVTAYIFGFLQALQC